MSDSEEDDTTGAETRGKMVQRHKREAKDLKAKTSKMGKKKKDEIEQLEKEMMDRQKVELRTFDAPPEDTLAKMEALTLVGRETKADAEDFTLSKSAKKRQAKMEAAEQRDKLIQEDNDSLGDTQRLLEERAIVTALGSAGLRMKDIKPDGHCLYRSVGHQLEVLGEPQEKRDVQVLRKLTADYMRQNPDTFKPFIEGGSEEEDGFEAYVTRVESTAEWGGQLELQALAHSLKFPIKVHSVGMPNVAFGEEYAADRIEGGINLAYLKHAFGLGEHYNSTMPHTTDSSTGEDEGAGDS